VLPRRRAGRAWSTREPRFLTRAEIVRLLDEVPAKWRRLFELLAASGLIFEFVETFYNATRRHSTLGYLSPAQFEAMTITNNQQNVG
jgi:transposase InsO family protein